MLKFNFNSFMIDKGLSVGEIAEHLEVHASQASRIIKRGKVKPKLLARLIKAYEDAKNYVTEVEDVSVR